MTFSRELSAWNSWAQLQSRARHSWKGKWGETRLKRDNSSWKREMGETRLKRGKNEAESRMLLNQLMSCYFWLLNWQPSNPIYIQSTMVEIFLYFFITAIQDFNSWLSVVSSSKSSHWHGWRSRNVVWKYFVIDWLNWRIHCQSCEISNILHGANLPNQILPQEKRENRDKFNT